MKRQRNVIIRNMNISKVRGGDAIGIEYSTNVWIDHCDLSSDVDHGKDYYDGLLDITHGSDWVSVTNTYFHDHVQPSPLPRNVSRACPQTDNPRQYKTLLISHSDSNSAEDAGKLHVTLSANHWRNVNSRTPSIRFGTAHVLNSLYEHVAGSGVNTRMGARVLVESTVFEDVRAAVTARDSPQRGAAVLRDVRLGSGGAAEDGAAPPEDGGLAPEAVPYPYVPWGSETVPAEVLARAGQRLGVLSSAVKEGDF
jgi:pectate lyase